MKVMPEIRFVRAWQSYLVGNVIRPPATLRDWLIRAGFCVMVEPVIQIQCSTDAPAPKPTRRKRGVD